MGCFWCLPFCLPKGVNVCFPFFLTPSRQDAQGLYAKYYCIGQVYHSGQKGCDPPGCQAKKAHDWLSCLRCPSLQRPSQAGIALSTEVLLNDTEVLDFRQALDVYWVQVP